MQEILKRIDHTFLKIDSNSNSSLLLEGAKMVEEKGLRSFIVPPQLVRTVAKHFPDITVGTVVAFPLGFETLPEKIFASQQAREDGAKEVDIVLDLFALVNDNFRKVNEEVDLLTEVGRRHGLKVKFILEMSILSEAQISECVALCLKHKPLAIKSGTGYQSKVSTEQITLLKKLTKGEILVKASGGIDSINKVKELISSGADIIGTSNTKKIISELEQDNDIRLDG